MSDVNSESLEQNNEIFFHPQKKVLYFRDKNGKLINLSNDNKEFLTLKKEITKNTKLTLSTKIDLTNKIKNILPTFYLSKEILFIPRNNETFGKCYYGQVKLNNDSYKNGFYLDPNLYSIDFTVSFENLSKDNQVLFFLRSNRVIVNSFFQMMVDDKLPKNGFHQFHINVKKKIYLEVGFLSKHKIDISNDDILICIKPIK